MGFAGRWCKQDTVIARYMAGNGVQLAARWFNSTGSEFCVEMAATSARNGNVTGGRLF